MSIITDLDEVIHIHKELNYPLEILKLTTAEYNELTTEMDLYFQSAMEGLPLEYRGIKLEVIR